MNENTQAAKYPRASVRKAHIFYKDRMAGILEKTKHGYIFTYDDIYLSQPDAKPVSFSLPLRFEPYQAKDLFPFFENLLPEGWLLEIVTKVSKIDKSDKFSLLLHNAGDPVGAVSIQPAKE